MQKTSFEKIEPIVIGADLPVFPVFYRGRLTGADNRLYYKKGTPFYYSGVTTAIKKSGLVDYTHLEKARVKMAFDGIDADEVWGERRDYGTAFHTVVSNHERRDLYRQEFVFDELTDKGDAWRASVRAMAVELGFQQQQEQWVEDIQNDMAAWFLFKKEYGVSVIASEVIVSNDNWKIATPLDIVCVMEFNKKRIVANINLKTGTSGHEGKDYTLQVCLEEKLWNQTMIEHNSPQYILGGTFLWRPKDRIRAAGKYHLSKNYSGAHTEEELNHVINGVLLNRLYEPKGVMRKYSGNEENFTVQEITAMDYLREFNENQ